MQTPPSPLLVNAPLILETLAMRAIFRGLGALDQAVRTLAALLLGQACAAALAVKRLSIPWAALRHGFTRIVPVIGTSR